MYMHIMIALITFVILVHQLQLTYVDNSYINFCNTKLNTMKKMINGFIYINIHSRKQFLSTIVLIPYSGFLSRGL